MANNTIQIKRSPSTAAPTSLNPGELAYSNAVGGTGVLYIGSTDGGTVVPIGGVRNPGTLTANQALVANSTSGINQIITSNVITQYISANGSYGTAGYILFSGGATSNAYWVPSSAVSINAAAQYTWTNTQTFSNTITFNSSILANTVNATSYTTGGGYGTSTGGLTANVTTIGMGNTTTNTFITNGLVQTTNGFYSVGQFNGSYSDGIVVDYVNTNGRISVGSADSLTFYTGGVGTTSMAVVNTTGIYTGGVVNAASHTVGTSFVANTTVLTSSGNATFSGANVVISGTNTYISSNVTLGGASITGTSTDLSIRNATVSGNLIVSGSVVSINVSTLVVNDNVIELGDNNTTTDTIDTGWYSPAGNSSSIWYSGIARIANKSSNNNPYFWVFGSNTNPNTATTIDSSSNSITGSLQAYLLPYGTGGAFVANSTAVNITANSTVSASIVANSLTLSTALSAINGGTGQSSYSTGDLLYASSSTALSKLSVPGSAANGQVLQITNNLPAYGTLDGGTF